MENKVPQRSYEFLIDQCGPRILTISPEQNGYSIDNIHNNEYDHSDEDSSSFAPSISEADAEVDNTYFAVDVKNISLPTFTAALDRGNVSNRIGALLATALLKDLNISEIIIDQHKIRREREKSRSAAVQILKCNDRLECISFDGKREKTLKQIMVNNTARNIRVTEEHITMVKEPNSNLIGYVTPTSGSSDAVCTEMMNFLKEQRYLLDHLIAINCDGTRCNTGKNRGTISILERRLERPLQWFICLFHFNELPFTALLKHLIGKANGPHNWPGLIGNSLQDCENVPPAHNFDAISMGEMPENIDAWELRDDQKYLFNMVRAVDSGVCSDFLASIKPGPLNLSRWLTTASRILRLYVTQPVASEKLKKLAFFVVKVYAPFWFLVKEQPQAINGSRHLLQYIKWMRQLPTDMQEIVQRSIQINGFFAHPENILLSMIIDKSKSVRKEGYEKIFKFRSNTDNNIRQFVVPKILFNATSLSTLIDWDEAGITEPPCLQFHSLEFLMSYYDSDDIIQVPEFPCHSQNTERFVRTVSQSATSVVDKNRLGYIANKIESRKCYKRLQSRQDFV